jgi:hypothetical protein
VDDSEALSKTKKAPDSHFAVPAKTVFRPFSVKGSDSRHKLHPLCPHDALPLICPLFFQIFPTPSSSAGSM